MTVAFDGSADGASAGDNCAGNGVWARKAVGNVAGREG